MLGTHQSLKLNRCRGKSGTSDAATAQIVEVVHDGWNSNKVVRHRRGLEEIGPHKSVLNLLNGYEKDLKITIYFQKNLFSDTDVNNLNKWKISNLNELVTDCQN